MEWMQFLGFILTVGGLFFWSRTESSADRRELRASIDALRDSTASQLKAIHDEQKDFHGRLISLEERYLKMKEKEKCTK